MNINVELPGWIDERHLWIVAGTEPVACRIKLVDGDGKVTYKWYRKVQRCNLCGKCCMNLRTDHAFVKADGTCEFLIQTNPSQYECHAPYGMPWGCLTGQGRPKPWSLEIRAGVKIIPECTVEYEEM